MGISYSIEQGIKTACKAATDALAIAPELRPVYRTFFGDDEPAAEDEARRLPSVMIIAGPDIPTGYQSIFSETAVRIEIATYAGPEQDPKGAIIKAIYESVRAVIDADTWTVTGATKKSAIIEGGESECVDMYNLVSLTLNVSTCIG